MSIPSIPLPEPLRAAERNTFTHYSVATRLVNIARRALEENNLPDEAAARIQALMDEIPNGKVRQVDVPLYRDAASWMEYIRAYEGMDWLEIPWFFAEEYFYLRILEASGYFHPCPWQNRDPYAYQKRLGLEATQHEIKVLADQLQYAISLPAEKRLDSLERMLLLDLWGNQNDLSMWPVNTDSNGATSSGSAAKASAEAVASAHAHVLADDTPALLAYLDSIPAGTLRIDILLDNAGYELVADLALADFLLETGLAGQVVLHAKSYPVFVSDALPRDIHQALDFLAFDHHLPVKGFAIRLRRCLIDGRLSLRQHPFWTSPLPLWDMPEDLAESLRGSHLLISKGDANYRRLLGDRHWPTDLPFQQVVAGYPFGVLALRTLKSEIAVGVAPDKVPQNDAEWMINGRWGLIQFSPPA